MRATAGEQTPLTAAGTRLPCQPPSPLRTSSSLAHGFTGTQWVPRPVEAPGGALWGSELTVRML